MLKRNVSVRGSPKFTKFYFSLEANGPLKRIIDGAMDKLKSNPTLGDKIEKKLWPKKYVRGYGINNLFRYRLGSNLRMIYTILSEDDQIVCVILEVLVHKEYDKLFGYKTS